MVWSAGQREFVPLLLGLYWLMPSTQSSRRGTIEWVVLEEVEMGLHPRAISVLLLMVLELVTRGYRVCLSTHSPQISG
jgi:predicted ATPase